MDFEGKVLLEDTHVVDVSPLSSKVYLDWPLKKITDAGAADTSRVFVVSDLSSDGAEVSRNLIYLAPTKQVHLKPATLRVETTGTNGKYKIRLTSPVLARDVYLSFGDLDAKLSDNYVDILPGESIEITATTSASLDTFKAQLRVISLTDAFAPGGSSAVISAAH
jgi:beta-mannosidase